MKMNRNEMEALMPLAVRTESDCRAFAYGGCPSPDPAAKKLFYMLSVKLSAEGVERWYRCFYRKLRVLKDRREGCYDETYED